MGALALTPQADWSRPLAAAAAAPRCREPLPQLRSAPLRFEAALVYLCRQPCKPRLGFDRSMCARGADGVSRRTQLHRPKMQPDPPRTAVTSDA